MKVYAIVTYPFAAIWFLVKRREKEDPEFFKASIGYFRVTMFPRMFEIMHELTEPEEKSEV